MKSVWLGLVLSTALLTGCHSRPEIAVSEQQTLVMESNVLAAGISAGPLAFTASDIQATADSTLFNERREPVTVHYRFYWYDARGLEMHPLEAARSITVPPMGSVTLKGTANSLGAHKARLYLYL